MREAGIRRMKRQRNEGDEAVGDVLRCAQLEQVIHALFGRFDVAVEHGGVGAQAEFVRGARDFQPALAADFVIADNFAHARMENFGAAAGKRIHAGIFHGEQRVANGKLGDARVVADFDHGEGFQVHLREALFQAADQGEVILERQIGMQAADDVKFRGAFGDAVTGALVNFFESEGVGAGRIGRAAKGAELAVRDADVGGIDVAIDVEIGDVAVLFFADVVREPAYRQKIVGFDRARGRLQR